MMETLRGMFTEVLNEEGETWTDVIGREITIESNKEVNYYPFRNKQRPPGTRISDIPEEEQLDLEFDDGHGCSVPIFVTLWTAKNIYFNYDYDGRDFVIIKPRNPPEHEHNNKIELLRKLRDYYWSIYVQNPLNKPDGILFPDYNRDVAKTITMVIDICEGREPNIRPDSIKYKYGEWPE